jgi:excisionase family DNA binding protein
MSCHDYPRSISAEEHDHHRISTHEPTHLHQRADAAKYLGMSVSWLAKAAVNGGGQRFVKIGRAVRYRRSDLDDYLVTKIRRSTSDVEVGQSRS